MKLRQGFERRLITPGEPCVASGRQVELSRQMTGLVDVLYALVLVEGAVAYRSLFAPGSSFFQWDTVPVVLALVLVYFMTIQSFTDFHLASEDQPYQFLDKEKRRTDLWRFYLDVVIVGLYSFVLLQYHVLLDSPGADISVGFFAFPAIFALYVLWGILRRKTARGEAATKQYKNALLFLCLALYGLLAVLYWRAVPHGVVANSACLFAALLVMVFFRWMNWQQNQFFAKLPKPPACPSK